jgi:hypothetical protein
MVCSILLLLTIMIVMYILVLAPTLEDSLFLQTSSCAKFRAVEWSNSTRASTFASDAKGTHNAPTTASHTPSSTVTSINKNWPPLNSPTPLPSHQSLSCCLHIVSVDDLMRQYPPEIQKENWRWSAVAPHKIDGGECIDYWIRLTLQEAHAELRGGFYLERLVKEILGEPNQYHFSFLEEEPQGKSVVPRALFLGDSISHGIWERLLALYSSRGVHLAGAPTNCYEFNVYNDSLLHWLGPCQWDFVQFNVGMHFHPAWTEGNWQEVYQHGIRDVARRIHDHSPSAKIVIALTTPSPLDTNATFPLDDGSCPHLKLFHKPGVISSMNDIIRSIQVGNESIPGLWGINDRYTLMVPNLIDYQLPCDIHFTQIGYDLMAEQDWSMLVTALNMQTG